MLVTSLSRAADAAERFRFFPEEPGVGGGGGMGLPAAAAALVLATSANAFIFSILDSTGVSWIASTAKHFIEIHHNIPNFVN